MGLLLGLGLIGLAFVPDMAFSFKCAYRNDLNKKYSVPESEEHILYILRNWKDDEGNKVIDYCDKHTGYDSRGVYHNCFREEAVYNLAKAQCKRHGIEIGMTEAKRLCFCPQVREFWEGIGYYK